jgi:hypothetical protein
MLQEEIGIQIHPGDQKAQAARASNRKSGSVSIQASRGVRRNIFTTREPSPRLRQNGKRSSS